MEGYDASDMAALLDRATQAAVSASGTARVGSARARPRSCPAGLQPRSLLGRRPACGRYCRRAGKNCHYVPDVCQSTC
jgi:hypothetical protein